MLYASDTAQKKRSVCATDQPSRGRAVSGMPRVPAILAKDSVRAGETVDMWLRGSLRLLCHKCLKARCGSFQAESERSSAA